MSDAPRRPRGCSSATSRSSRRPPAPARRCAARRSASVDVIEDAFVLCEGADRRGRARCATSAGSTATSRSSTARASARSRGSSTATRTRASRGDRVEEFALRAAGASYEELHAAGGGILSTVRATRAAGEDGAAARPSSATAAGCCARARRRSRRSPATGSTARPSSRRCARSRPRAELPTWLGAHAVPPEFDDADAYLDFAARRGAARGRASSPRPPTSSSSAARSTPSRRAATSRPAATAGLALRLHGDQFTEPGAVPLAIELGARSVDHLEATGAEGVDALAASDVVGRPPAGERALPRPPDAAGPRARRRRRRGRARDRLQPGQRVLREPAARLLARLHAARPFAGRGARRLHGQRGARARPGRAQRAGSRPGYDADLVLLDAPDWRHLAYHLGGDVIAAVVSAGVVAWAREPALGLARWPRGSSGAGGEGAPARVRVRLRRRRRPRGRGRRRTSSTSERARRNGKRRRQARAAEGARGASRRDGRAAVLAARAQRALFFAPLIFLAFSAINSHQALLRPAGGRSHLHGVLRPVQLPDGPRDVPLVPAPHRHSRRSRAQAGSGSAPPPPSWRGERLGDTRSGRAAARSRLTHP